MMVETKIDYDAQILAALQEIADALDRIAAAIGDKRKDERRSRRAEKERRTEKKSTRKLTPGNVMHMIEEEDPDVYEMVKNVRAFPSGDLLVTFEKLDKSEYRRFKEVMEELFNAKYNPKYRGFIIKQS